MLAIRSISLLFQYKLVTLVNIVTHLLIFQRILLLVIYVLYIFR